MTRITMSAPVILRTCAVGIIAALVGQAASAGDAARRTARIVFVDEVRGFLRKTTLGSCEAVVSLWRGSQSFERLALAEELLDHFKSTEKCRIANYEWKPGTDDMSRVAGRAKWAFEQILGVRLANVTPTSVEEDLRTLHYDASRLLTAYRNGILSVAGDGATSPERLKELKDKYGGKIEPGISLKAPGYSRAMHELPLEWPPIGKCIIDLYEVVGSEGRRTDDGVSYRFDTGYGGVEYQLAVSGGKIVSVRAYGLE